MENVLKEDKKEATSMTEVVKKLAKIDEYDPRPRGTVQPHP